MPHSTSESTKEKMGKRVPSFYTSPSLVNLGGLNVGDQTTIQEWSPYTREETPDLSTNEESATWAHHSYAELGQGWGGMGLRGNFSSGSLVRQSSNSSGLFMIDASDDEDDESEKKVAAPVKMKQKAYSSHHDLGSAGSKDSKYIKTSSMASFYYRKIQSEENLLQHQMESTSY